MRHATANYPMALAIVNSIRMHSMKCGYTTWKALLTELKGSAMEERKRLEEITAGQLRNEPVQVYVRRYRNLWNMLNKAHGQWTFEYVATRYLIPGLRPDYDHIVDITISAATINERLATIISAGQNMEARKRQRQQRVRTYPPNLNYYNPRDPQHATRPDVVRHGGVVRHRLQKREPAERRVSASYGHNPCDNYNHHAPPVSEGPSLLGGGAELLEALSRDLLQRRFGSLLRWTPVAVVEMRA
eukprot:jgi/Tetstr1/466302/TSEL_010835.t1